MRPEPLLLALLASSASAGSFSHTVRVFDAAGEPVTGPIALTVELVDGDTVAWSAAYDAVAYDGVVTVTLDDVDDSLLSADLSLRSTADGVVFSPEPLRPVAVAAVARSVDGGAVHASALTVSGGLTLGAVSACSTAGVVAWDAAENAVKVCDGTAWSYFPAGASD